MDNNALSTEHGDTEAMSMPTEVTSRSNCRRSSSRMRLVQNQITGPHRIQLMGRQTLIVTETKNACIIHKDGRSLGTFDGG